MIGLKADVSRARSQIQQAQQSIRQRATLFQNLRSQFVIRRIREIFATNGDGMWRPTHRSNPILRDTNALFRSYTIPGARGNINRVNNNMLEFGSSLPYADTHEEGEGHIVARPIIGLLDNRMGDRRVSQIAERWYQRRLDRST